MRSVPLWQSDNHDATVPQSAKLRILARQEDKCASCGIALGALVRPEFDHITALVNGGAHSEDNLQALCGGCHKHKTKKDVREKAKVARVKAKAMGIRAGKAKIQSRGFAKAEPQRSATRPLKRPLPRREV